MKTLVLNALTFAICAGIKPTEWFELSKLKSGEEIIYGVHEWPCNFCKE